MLVTGVGVWKHILVNAGVMVWQRYRRQHPQDILYSNVLQPNRPENVFIITQLL